MAAQSYLSKFFFLANFFLVTGLVINYALPPVIDMFINKQIALTPESQTYPMWKEPPVPIYQKFYFFNVTNAQEIESFGAKPALEEIGPFTYRAEFSKRDIEATTATSGQQQDDQQQPKSIINFKHFKSWQFEPDMSIADHRLQLVTLNAPLAITLTLIQSASNAVRLLVTFSLDGLSDGFFTKRTVKQLLFDGYPDLLTTFGPLLNAEMLSQGGHFGYMNARNNSQDGAYEINSGEDDISKLNTINKFNGRSKLPYWHSHYNSHHNNNNNHCNSLEGSTTGEMFPPIQEGQTSVRLFQPDFCRVWRLDYDKQLEQTNGLRLKRFKATRDVFRNSTDLQENSCFFKRSHSGDQHSMAGNRQQAGPGANRVGRNRHQSSARQSGAGERPQQQHHHHHGRVRHEWPAGVFTLAPCKFNAPIYMSMPHFLDADPYFSAQVDGLKPDANRHEFYIDLEPRTGSPVTLSARVQLNVAISKPPGLVRFRNVPEIMFPVFWQELTVNLSGPVIDQLLLASRGAQEANIRISYSFLLLGITILITTAIFYLHAKLTEVSQEHQQEAQENNK